MACTVHNGRLYDTVTETSFGPQFETDDEAQELLVHVWRTQAKDPRRGDADLTAALVEIQTGVAASMPTHPAMLCVCGSGKLRLSTTYHRGEISTQCKACNGT